MSPGWTYALALLTTIVIETGVACLLRRRQAPRLLADVPLMNLASHPLLYLAVGAGLPIAAGELLVMLFETLAYRTVTGLSWRWSVRLGVILNAVTWLIGLALFA